MGRLLKMILLGSLLLLLLSPLAVYFLVLSDKPQALPTEQLDSREIMRVQRLVAQQVARSNDAGRVNLTLTEKDLKTAFAFGQQAAKVPLLEGSSLKLEDDHLLLFGNLKLPLAIGRNIINFRVRLEADGQHPLITRLKLGYISVPGPLLAWLQKRGIDLLETDERLGNARKTWDSIEQLSIADQRVNIVYQITPAVIDSVTAKQKKLLLEQIDTQRVARYTLLLEQISQKTTAERYPLTGMVGPAYDLARKRTSAGFDAVEENSAALIALGLYAADPKVIQMTGLATHLEPSSRRLALTLHRRNDLATHFVTAALISLFAGDQVADLMGMQKELEDSQSSSGFGLADLVADKAGIRFAYLATINDKSARQLQEQLSHLLYDDELLPSPDDLPQLDIAGDLARLDDNDLEPYLANIERRINDLLKRIPLYRL
jgi:hypothetical protein